MKRYKSYILMAAGCVALALIAAVLTAGPAVAQLAKAVLMANVDERGRIPYEVSSLGAIGGPRCTSGECEFTFPGPKTGKRLVITNVNVIVTYPVNQGVVEIELRHTFSSSSPRAFLPSISTGFFPFVGTPNFGQRFVVNERVLAYYDPGYAP